MEARPAPLPPMQTLQAFEAAARLASFTRAAEELHLTQGAVSRQIRLLEDRLGVLLFQRGDRGVRLTVAGGRYLAVVREALQRLAAATGELRAYSGDGPVTIGATSALASLWLMPRLTGFRRVAADLDIRVLASDHGLPVASSEVDLMITYSRSRPAGGDVRPLFDEIVFPVCAPDYPAAGRIASDPQALLGEALLVLDDDHPDWIGWPAWFEHAGLGLCEPRRSIRVNSYPMLLQAAVAGQGVALGWQHLVDDLLTAGNLLALPGPVLRTAGRFFLCSLRPIPQESPAGRLRAWLAASAPRPPLG